MNKPCAIFNRIHSLFSQIFVLFNTNMTKKRYAILVKHFSFSSVLEAYQLSKNCVNNLDGVLLLHNWRLQVVITTTIIQTRRAAYLRTLQRKKMRLFFSSSLFLSMSILSFLLVHICLVVEPLN
jgi:hypothetical protein